MIGILGSFSLFIYPAASYLPDRWHFPSLPWLQPTVKPVGSFQRSCRRLSPLSWILYWSCVNELLLVTRLTF